MNLFICLSIHLSIFPVFKFGGRSIQVILLRPCIYPFIYSFNLLVYLSSHKCIYSSTYLLKIPLNLSIHLDSVRLRRYLPIYQFIAFAYQSIPFVCSFSVSMNLSTLMSIFHVVDICLQVFSSF